MKFSTTGQEKDDLLKQVTDSLRGDHLGRFDFSYSISTLVSSTNKTDSHDITEILLKVALNTISLTLYVFFAMQSFQGAFNY
jgi:hypothetical protein